MITESLSRLLFLCQDMPDKFLKISEEEFSAQSSPEKWSKKEILGHLIDSATNNHHRFIRSQFEDMPFISYDGEQWVSSSHYQEMATDHLILVWQIYNVYLAELIRKIPDVMMQRMCDSGDPAPHTLKWLFDDYVVHLEHHLHQIVEYNE